MQEITLKVIMQTVFGFNEGEKCEQFRSLLADWLDLIASPLRSSFIFLKFLQVDWGAWSPWGNFIILGSNSNNRCRVFAGSFVISPNR
jgi:unspecific monooxygenase